MTLEQFLLALAVIALSVATGIIFAIGWSFVRKRNPPLPTLDLSSNRVTPIDIYEMRLFRSIARNVCPDCNGFGFYGGPTAGHSQNIFCVNPKCRAAFNVTFFTSTDGKVERIAAKTEEWYANAE
jgi:hypothetical protein